MWHNVLVMLTNAFVTFFIKFGDSARINVQPNCWLCGTINLLNTKCSLMLHIFENMVDNVGKNYEEVEPWMKIMHKLWQKKIPRKMISSFSVSWLRDKFCNYGIAEFQKPYLWGKVERVFHGPTTFLSPNQFYQLEETRVILLHAKQNVCCAT